MFCLGDPLLDCTSRCPVRRVSEPWYKGLSEDMRKALHERIASLREVMALPGEHKQDDLLEYVALRMLTASVVEKMTPPGKTVLCARRCMKAVPPGCVSHTETA